MSEFDPFAVDSFAPNDSDGVFFGELIFHRGFQGIWMPDETSGKNVLTDFNPNDDAQKAVLANGKKPYVYYTVQFFPIGANWESYADNLAVFSDEWKELCKSLAVVWGCPKVKSPEFEAKLRQCATNTLFVKYHTEIIEYIDKNGVDRKRYIKRVQEIYPDLVAAQAAYDARHGIDGTVDRVPDGFKVEAWPREQAITFVEALIASVKMENNGKFTPTLLQKKFDSMPQMANITVADSDVQSIIDDAIGIPF